MMQSILNFTCRIWQAGKVKWCIGHFYPQLMIRGLHSTIIHTCMTSDFKPFRIHSHAAFLRYNIWRQAKIRNFKFAMLCTCFSIWIGLS